MPLRIYSESVAKQIPIDKCVCITSIIHLGKLALIMVYGFRMYQLVINIISPKNMEGISVCNWYLYTVVHVLYIAHKSIFMMM